MTYLDTRELYGLFLGSDFWVNLSRNKRRQIGKCERCGSVSRLESHHKFYRENWFDTLPDDLEVLCRGCHEKQHGIQETVKTPEPTTTYHSWIRTWKDLQRARSSRQITRKTFLALARNIRSAYGQNKEDNKRRRQEKLKAKLQRSAGRRRSRGNAVHRTGSRWWPGMYEGKSAEETMSIIGTAKGFYSWDR